jgi:P27 family predicted phage terminase small subunit
MSNEAGRPAKPTHLKVLHGDRDDRINHDEPQPAVDVAPPFALTKAARAVWDRLAPDMQRKGVLTAWDVDLFAELCEAVVRLRTARRGSKRKPESGGVSPMREYSSALDMVVKLSSRFGMTPSDRSKLGVDRGGESNDDLLSGSG